MRLRLLALALAFTAAAAAQQLPPGTHNADDHTREAVDAARMQNAETALEKGDFTAAESALRALALDHPHDAHILFDLGFAQEHNGEDAEAETSYKAALAADPANAEAQVSLGLLDARRNRLPEARRELRTVADSATASPQLRGRALRALALIDQQSNPAQATDEILKAIQLTGETSADTEFAGETALRAGDFPDAERAFVKALSADPDNINARLGLARALAAEKRPADAEATLQPALKAHPADERVVAQLAAVYAAEGKEADAIPLLETVRRENPAAAQNRALSAMLARLYAMNGRDADAEPLLRSLLASTPDDPVLLDELGGVQLRQAQYAQAQQTLTRAVALRAAFHDDRAWAEAESHLAFAAQRNQQPAVALQALAARSTVLPDSPASLFLQATAFDALHQYKNAARLYRAFLQSAGGKFPDEEFEARHRLVALDHAK